MKAGSHATVHHYNLGSSSQGPEREVAKHTGTDVECIDSTNQIVDLTTNLLTHASQGRYAIEGFGRELDFLDSEADEEVVDLVAEFKR